MSRAVADQSVDEVCREAARIVDGRAAMTAALPATIESRLDAGNLHPGDIHRQKVVLFAVSLLKAADQAVGHDPAGARRRLAEATALLLTVDAPKEPVPRDGAAPSARGGLAPWQISRVTEFIGANLARAIRIEELAAVTRLSTGHFRGAFRCSMGETPYGYVLRRRMEHAQELMLLTDASLSQIALDCGFTDQPHLTRLFHRIVGVTPGAWRRQRRAGTRKSDNTPAERAFMTAA
jgi:AraC family transcriptional regulator